MDPGTPYRAYPRLLPQTLAAALALLFTACSDNEVTAPPTRPQLSYVTPTGLLTANPPQVFVGAGDISSCSTNNDELTAELLDNIPGTVFNIGDDAYNNGTTSEFNNCYDPTWGRHKARTKPTAGNHEYNTSGASGYFNYFGAAAGTPGQGYYSFDLGAWHIIALNSNISMSLGSAQNNWLRSDLAAHTNICTLAYFHHPLYSSVGGTGSGGATYSSVRPLWDALYAYGADLILGGHRHDYERLAPMKPDGTEDDAYGIREIIAGTGGIGGATMTNIFPTSQVRNGSTFGVLKLYLYDDSYAWKFVPITGKTFSDSGSTACHGVAGSGGGGAVSSTLSTVAASPASVTASSGSSSSTITVTVKDGSGNPISGATVTLSATGSGNTLTQPSGTTNSNGAATGTLSSTTAEAKIVTATASGVSISQTDTVTVTPATASALGFSVQPANTAAGSAITPAVQVEVRDQFGNRVTSATNSVTSAIGTNPSGGSLSGTKTVAASNGVATFSNLSIDKAGTGYTLTASATGLSGATSTAFNITAVSVVSASLSSVVAAPTSITAGSGPSTITVTVRDGSGNPVSGVTVSLAATGAGNTIVQPASPTDNSGTATGTLSSTVAEPKTITATADGVTLSQQPIVTVTAGSADATHSSVAASPTTILASSGTSTISVTVRDAYSNPVSGSTVLLSATGSDNTLTQPAGPTDASGTASGTLSSTTPETKTISATADGLLLSQTASVTVTTATQGISQTLLTVGTNTVNQSMYTTGTISPAPNTLVTVAVLGYRSSGASPTPTVSGGGMSSWDVVSSVTFDVIGTPLRRLTVYRAMSASPGSGPITITFSGSQSNCQWIVSQWSGVDQSGSNGSGAIGQIGSNATDGSTGLAVALGQFANASNVAYGAFGVNSNTLTQSPGAGFTEIAEQPSGESTPNDLMAEWATNLATINATWSTSLRAGGLGIEIKAATGP